MSFLRTIEKTISITETVNSEINATAKALHKNKLLYRFLRRHLYKHYHVVIGSKIRLGKNVWFPHPHNIVIGEKTVIGDDCIIYHDVTFGQNKGLYPVIGNEVIIYTGAKIIGGITVGNNVVIGANSVVTKNVPDNAIVAGAPAKIIRNKQNNEKFY